MMQSERILPSWETFDVPCSNLDQSRLYDPPMDFLMWDNLDFSSSPEELSVISSNSNVPTMFSDELFDLPNLSDDIFIPSPMEGLETISSGEIADICGWTNESDYEANFINPVPTNGEEYSPGFSLESSEDSVVFPLTNGSNTLPGDMEMDNETSLHHLIKAYGEATENGQQELARVIVNSIEEKSNPLGKTMERIAFYLFQLKQNQGDYLRQESLRNFTAAFKAFYQGLPYGRLAHFVANSAILEAMPDDAETIHIVDFDIGEAIQWPPVIEAISQMHKALKFTLIKSDDECSSPCWDIEETKQRLQDHARELGLKLQIDEKSVSDLASEITRTKKRGQARECSFLDKLLKHYQALFESLELSFPVHLADARTALESLFLVPYMSSLHWFLDLEKLMENSDLQSETGLEGRKLSKQSIIEAKQIVNERENTYKVKIEGHREHEMVLEWKGTPLVRVSTWM
ncbi:unnamed protein product [Fraxinus pennsylvanica]|uniref:Nodulation signaling pathway 2-like protein n=1 Tax=Fraxinus pennsylvanica TaxID=56036 RepID=A0AAD2A6B0_9LAMI|nr:unnamed protein product [Fraxinus pennsylvanica]